jgi:RNA polymerase sigma factor (sigma-70 family)
LVDSEEAAETVRQATAGDADAWRKLVDSFGGLVWSVARSYRLGPADAEDVAQTTWERLAQSIGKLREPGSVGSWLAVTARHEALRVAEVRARTKPSGDLTWIGSAWIDDDSPERIVLDRAGDAERTAYARRAWHLLGQLPDGCQRLLRILLATPPPTYAEVAAALDKPIGYIGPTRQRCLEKLRLLL